MSAVISPLVYAALVLVNDLVSLLFPAADLLPVLAAAGPKPGAEGPGALLAVLLVGALLLPGSIVMLLAWLGVRALFTRGSAEGLLHSFGARPPREDDLEEQQLQNLVQEMAVAAGLRPPGLALLDDATLNAGAVGAGPDDATLILSRRLLEELDRDQTQGVIARLVGSVGNGDLRAALAMVSMHRAFGLVLAVLAAPFGPHARRTLLRLMRLGFRRGRSIDTRELDTIADMLSQSADLPDGDVYPSAKPTPANLFRLPFLAAAGAFGMARMAFVGFGVGPLLAWMWRSRHYLADATAVQLTRNPDAVARGLAALAARGGAIPGGSWAAPLFVIGAAGGSAGVFGDADFGLVTYSPPVAKRLARLRRQGAGVEVPVDRPTHWVARLFIAFGLTLLGTAVIGCALLLSGLALMIDLLILMPLVIAVHGGLRYLMAG